MRVAAVVVDVPSRSLDRAFDYLVPEGSDVSVGHCVLVDFGGRPVVGYVVQVSDESVYDRLKPLHAVLAGPYFDRVSAEVATWIADTYAAPLSEAIRLFTPPGAVPRAVRDPQDGSWTLRRPGVGPVDDRWAELCPDADFRPTKRATLQRAVLDALRAGPVRVAELTADLGSVDGPLRVLTAAGAVRVTRRRRDRTSMPLGTHAAPRHERLTRGQSDALAAIEPSLTGRGGVILLNGVTGSGKTEVYLRAIELALASGGSAIVLVPEISLTPQTVGRFRARFGDLIAVLHSRLSPGERLDQWDRVATGDARVVVGARSALFAPLRNVRVVIIDEEHEPSYKQESSPRYHARDVAVQLCHRRGATLILGSASPCMESLHLASTGEWTRVDLPERVTGRPLPPVTVVDMSNEFAAGNRSMFSRELVAALADVRQAGRKAVLFLNRRGFASFLLCRACGHVPSCASCTTSMTYHEVGARLACHHCGAVRAVPPVCPECGSPYLRQFGAGTQRVETELRGLFDEWPIVRMDADTTTGKGAHERLLAAFEAESSAVLLGTQMIAKGLDFPHVTLVGVIAADTTLNLPDFRAGERAYQLLQQVAGRAGRGDTDGRVVIQTYWPDHPAIRAVEASDPSVFYRDEELTRESLGYPPYGRLANIIVRARSSESASQGCSLACAALQDVVPSTWRILGPSPAPLARLKGVWRWHCLIKAPEDAPLGSVVTDALARVRWPEGVTWVVDVDPVNLM